MARRIGYYFSLASPWSYLGHSRFMDLAGRHALAVDWRPIALVGVFAETGGLPLAQRPLVRQRYRMLELQRWRAKLAMSFHLRPRFWPFDSQLADRLVIAIVASGQDPDAFVMRAFPAVWEQESNLAEEASLAHLLNGAGFDSERFLARAKAPDIVEQHQEYGREAIAAGVFGAPSYVLEGEVFWGQDRLELLADAMASGRSAYATDNPR